MVMDGERSSCLADAGWCRTRRVNGKRVEQGIRVVVKWFWEQRRG